MTATNPPPLGRTRLSNRAGDELRMRIVRGDWRPGDRLPSERQLSEQLGMSRASVREAIRGLEATGLLDVRHGLGVFVHGSADDTGTTSFSSWNTEHRYSIGELLAFRLLIEPELAALAAERTDPDFIDELDTIMNAMEDADEAGDLDTLVGLDTSFHDAITRRAGNQLYKDLLDGVGQMLVESRRISLGVPGRAGLVIDAHDAIVEAIRTGNADAAWTAMRNHLESFAADMHVQPVGY